MSAPPITQEGANNRPSHRNGSRDISASTEEPQFSSLYAERTEQTVLEELRRIKAQLKELSLRLPAAPELDEYECLDMRYMLRLASDEELVARLGVEGIRDALHKLGGPYLQIKSIRYIPKPSSPVLGSDGRTISDRCASLLMIVGSYQAEYEIRNSSSRISEAISFSSNCFMLQRKYQVQVEDFDKDENRGTFPHWTTFFRHYTQQSDIQVRVSFHRFLIETTSLQTALLICRMSIKIRFTTFKAIPFPQQGTPMFCYKCNTPGHFKEVCGYGQFRCGRCSGQHSTASCQSGDKLRCCNCMGPHAAWDHRCTDKGSQREHSKASYHRKVGPFWARWVNSEDPSSASKKQANPGPETSEQEPQKRQRVSETTLTSTTPSTTSVAKKQAAPKNPRGRPPNSARVCKDPRQTSILQFHTPVTASTATVSKQTTNEPRSGTPDTLGDTGMVDTESGDSSEEDMSMMDTDAASSHESAVAQGHHGNGDPGAESQPTARTDMDVADSTMADSQGSAESQVPVSGSGSGTANAEKKKKKKKNWWNGRKKTGKKAALARDETHERAEGSEGTKPQEKSTSEAKVLKDQTHCPGNNNNNNNNNMKKKTKEGKSKNKNDAKRQGGGAATSQGNKTGCNGELDASLDSSNGAKEVAQGTLTPGGKTGPGKGKGKGKGNGKGKARKGAKSPEKDVDMDIDTATAICSLL
ncbi:Hypothetical protein NCS54_01192100 [Fusarium falciforme]|uniref:Hypothetical protein n=1 Tax=Fusarium falciforme TaxID=195108 RepID=UPI0023012484|nr:Hypothetical protein NCS54_01192100 [Fusarium falciforme]WAO94342.1 Hypothetical protein NCS54_01192100 [Fusarium falciforme]